jgi:hypothetical protein
VGLGEAKCRRGCRCGGHANHATKRLWHLLVLLVATVRVVANGAMARLNAATKWTLVAEQASVSRTTAPWARSAGRRCSILIIVLKDSIQFWAYNTVVYTCVASTTFRRCFVRKTIVRIASVQTSSFLGFVKLLGLVSELIWIQAI